MATNRRIGKYLPPSNTSQSGIWEQEDLYASPQGAVVQSGLQFYIDPAMSASYSGSGSTAYDLSGNGKNATLVNSPTITGSAFTFLPGNNSYISCGNFGSFYAQGTISFWMNSTDVSNYRNPIHSIYQGSNAGFRFEQAGATGSSGTMGMLFGTDAGVSTGHQLGTFSSDTWYLITVTWNTSTNVAVGYVNGSQVFSESNTTWPTTLPSLTLGGGFSSSAERWYSGGIGAVMLYNKVLSATEVAQNYAALTGRYGSISTTIPSAPTVGTVSVAGNTTVSIPYTDNGTGGRYVQGHYATVTPSISATVTSQASPLTLTGPFAAGTAYSFKVSGYNQNGYSTLSTSSNTVTYNVPATMSAPTVSGTSTSLQVSYTAPNNNNSAITGYTVTSSGSGSLVLTSAATANPLTYSASFTQGQAYSFTIAATNYYGTGTASPSSNTITPYPSTVPGAPTIGTATDVGSGRAYNNGRADVTFSAPASNGGSAITSYTVKVYNSGGVYQSNASSGAGSPITITGLASNTAYKYTVYATNAVGSSAESGFSNLVTATTIPQAPTIGTATNSGSGRAYNNGLATVAYTANGTGGLTNTYTATSSPSSFTGTGGSPISVSGLASGTAYTFTVTASNSNGSATSSASNSITATTIPQAPTIGTATQTGATTATLTYTANGTGGLSNTYSVNGGGSGSGGSPISITGLSASTSYSFSVTATNSNGTATSGTSNSITTSLPSPTSVTYLVVAGGAGAGAGGGGAGGVRTGTLSVSGGTGYTLTVGGGGASRTNGNNSVFSSITSTGGGAGGNGSNGTSGGSGGGGGCGDGGNTQTYTGGAGTAGQGNNGGSSLSSSTTGGGGGGGAGAVGAAAGSGGAGGAGGNGTASSISGSSVTYGGGGGGSPYNMFTTYAGGGTGGGGRGDSWNSPYSSGSPAYTAGTPNTGGGGGATNSGGGKAGGSGIVIISYPNTYGDLTSISGITYTGPVNTGGNKVYTFTAGTGTVTI